MACDRVVCIIPLGKLFVIQIDEIYLTKLVLRFKNCFLSKSFRNSQLKNEEKHSIAKLSIKQLQSNQTLKWKEKQDPTVSLLILSPLSVPLNHRLQLFFIVLFTTFEKCTRKLKWKWFLSAIKCLHEIVYGLWFALVELSSFTGLFGWYRGAYQVVKWQKGKIGLRNCLTIRIKMWSLKDLLRRNLVNNWTIYFRLSCLLKTVHVNSRFVFFSCR